MPITPPIQTILQVGQGPRGLSGTGGSGSAAYTHIQSSASSAWTVNHNLGYMPAVKALSVGGKEFFAEIVHTSANQALIYFDNPTAGKAVCS